MGISTLGTWMRWDGMGWDGAHPVFFLSFTKGAVRRSVFFWWYGGLRKRKRQKRKKHAKVRTGAGRRGLCLTKIEFACVALNSRGFA